MVAEEFQGQGGDDENVLGGGSYEDNFLAT